MRVGATPIGARQLQLPAHKVGRRSHGGVVRVEPFGSDRFGLNGIVVVHAGLDAADAYVVPSPDSPPEDDTTQQRG
jgi:hypothetical protein